MMGWFGDLFGGGELLELLRARRVRVETQERVRYEGWPEKGTVIRLDPD